MEKELIFGLIKNNMREPGNRIKWMEKEFSNGLVIFENLINLIGN